MKNIKKLKQAIIPRARATYLQMINRLKILALVKCKCFFVNNSYFSHFLEVRLLGSGERGFKQRLSIPSTKKIMLKGKTIVFCISVLSIQSCGRQAPEGTYYGGDTYNPSEFYYQFSKNGDLSICRGKLYDRNCCSDGYWEKKGNSIIVTGINNANCPEMSLLNGKYLACDDDCIPSGKAWIKGDIRLWPN